MNNNDNGLLIAVGDSMSRQKMIVDKRTFEQLQRLVYAARSAGAAVDLEYFDDEISRPHKTNFYFIKALMFDSAFWFNS